MRWSEETPTVDEHETMKVRKARQAITFFLLAGTNKQTFPPVPQGYPFPKIELSITIPLHTSIPHFPRARSVSLVQGRPFVVMVLSRFRTAPVSQVPCSDFGQFRCYAVLLVDAIKPPQIHEHAICCPSPGVTRRRGLPQTSPLSSTLVEFPSPSSEPNGPSDRSSVTCRKEWLVAKARR
ncbi:hypothetical protein CONLIGDRAFT_61094 [Coniochaeta ligniaria NRRL 30616]|uniref:Uncharacterized protein n=1 Tax=Coniochaeta ligniaria NRRL 30616 TaxID=1408157 RepID=A0A1J7K5I8_9PEZI|nr:hypothetical protein CONLIGDRAFT_61094 [Coniochaeta ligniaria NRRL 30616]